MGDVIRYGSVRRRTRSRGRWFRGIDARHIGGLLIVGVMVAGLLTMFWQSGFTPMDTLRHLLASPNCAAARAVGLAPSRVGEPGYWPGNDADGDGVACEAYWPRVPRYGTA